MGIQPESSHHEEGPGQNEVDFRYSDPLLRRGQRRYLPHRRQNHRRPERAVRGLFPQTSGGTPRQRISHQYVRSGRCGSAHAPGNGRDSGQDHGHDPIPQPHRAVLQPLGRTQSTEVHFVVEQQPLPAHSRSCRLRRVPALRAAQPRLHRQPISCLCAADLGGVS